MIDTHLHLIEPDRFSYPWLMDVPQLQSSYNLHRYENESQGLGIAGSVFLEVDVAVEDQAAEAEYFCSLAEATDNSILGVVAGCRPEFEDFQEQLARLQHPKVVGVRRILHVVEDSISQSMTFRNNVAALADRDLSFDMCVRADQLALALEVFQAAPQTQFVLDHCGDPPQVGEDSHQTWRDDLARCAELPNVACKVSGLGAHCGQSGDPTAALSPILNHASAHFGWDRLLFGGDWPVCLLADTPLTRWTEIVCALLSDQSEECRTAFFSGNAIRIYGLH